MDYLLKASAPLLDGVLSRPAQSILIELSFWTIGFLSFATVSSQLFRSLFKNCRFWYIAHKRGGVFALNAQDDLPALAVIGIQHVIGGLLMTLGVLRSDPTLWRHGLLCEAGYEVGDIISLSLSLFPYDVKIKEQLKVPIVCHHIPGIVLSFAALLSDLHYNEHLRSIGMWLLLAGGVSLLASFYGHTIDFRTNMPKAAIAFVLNNVFFMYARLWAFPMHSLHLIKDVKEDDNQSDKTLYVLYASAALYSVFNIGVLAEQIPLMFRYIMRAVDGVTAIDTKPVPPPKEGRMDRRRSSIVRVMETMGVNPKRQSVVKSLQKWEDVTETGFFSSRRYSAIIIPDKKIREE